MMADGLSNTWGKLETFLNRLYNNDNELIESWLTPDHYMSLYTCVYDYCVGKKEDVGRNTNIQGQELYENLELFYQKYLPTLNIPTVKIYLERWWRYELAAHHVEAIFHYLDRFWVKRAKEEGRDALPIYPLLWNLWEKHVLDGHEEMLLNYIDRQLVIERSDGENGMLVDNDSDVKTICQSYHTLSMIPFGSLLQQGDSDGKSRLKNNLFRERLLPWYCDKLTIYCKTLLERSLPSIGTIGLTKKLLAFWDAEIDRVNTYLYGDSMSIEEIRKRAKNTMKTSLIVSQFKDFQVEIQEALEKDEDPGERLGIIYKFVSLRKSLLSHLVEAMEHGFYARLCTRLPRITEQEQLLIFISLLSAMFGEGRRLVRNALFDDPQMSNALDMALRTFVNSTNAKATFAPLLPEYLCRWIDKSIKDTEITPVSLEFIITLLKFIDDKDSFQKWYGKLLARRLLAKQGKFNHEAELLMLEQLSRSYGQGFVINYHRMLTDSDISSQLTSKFLGKTTTKRTRLPFDLCFQILGSGNWPFNKEDPINWDGRVSECLDSFAHFYLGENSKRIIHWCPSLTTAEVNAVFANGKSYTFIVSAIQWSILNAIINEPLSSDMICSLVGINHGSFGFAISKLLSSHLVEISSTNLYKLNESFTSPHVHINLSVDVDRIIIQPREVIEDRSLAIQAHIVRFLKRVHRVAQDQLRTEIGSIDGQFFDKSLLALREKEYISVEDDYVIYIP